MAGDESFRRSASSSTSWARRSLPSRPPPRSRCRISPSMAPPLSVASRSPLFASFASANAAAILCSVLMPAAALDLVLVVAGDLVGAVHPAAVHGGIGRHRARGTATSSCAPRRAAPRLARGRCGDQRAAWPGPTDASRRWSKAFNAVTDNLLNQEALVTCPMPVAGASRAWQLLVLSPILLLR